PILSEKLRDLLKNHFQMEQAGRDAEGARNAWNLLEAEASQSLLGFGTVADGIWQVGRFIGETKIMEQLAADHSAEWRSLAVSLLHVLVMGKLLSEGIAG